MRPQTSEHCPCLITALLAHIARIAPEHRFEMFSRFYLVLAVMKPNLRKRKVGFIISRLYTKLEPSVRFVHVAQFSISHCQVRSSRTASPLIGLLYQ